MAWLCALKARSICHRAVREPQARAQVLAEPIQTVMRKYGVAEPYEKLKEFTRGKAVTAESMQEFVDGLEGVPDEAKAQMRGWSPATYLGNAVYQARHVRDHCGGGQGSLGPNADT